MTCPDCEYHKNRAARWRAEAYRLIGHEIELPWVGLTDEEVEDAWEANTGHSIFGGDKSEGRTMYIAPDEVDGFARAIEAKLKEKNT